MKIAISFFCDLKKYVNYIKMLIMLTIITLSVSIIGNLVLKTKVVRNNILSLSANWISHNHTIIDIKMLKNLYGIFDENSYYLKAEKPLEKEKKKDLDQGFITSVVDTDEAVFKKNDANLNITNTDSVQKINVYDFTILNYASNRSIDIMGLLSKNIVLNKKSDPIFLYTTHTSESYTNSDRYKFGYTSLYRTTDARYNMLAVAGEFAKAMKEKNMNCIFDTTPHDYGTYEISYTNSRKTLTNAINNNERISLAIDMHRDAMADLTNGPTVEINKNKVAKIMFVMGIGSETYPNECWEDNLALVVKLQKLGEEMYPGLFRPMIIRNSKYNQDLIKYSFLIEIGTTGNTMEEAFLGARCLANILNKFYNN